MENASKALIIAGSVLLAILLVSLGIGILNGASTDTSKMDESAVNAFNSTWASYIDKTIKGSTVKTMLQKIVENNATEANSGEEKFIAVNFENIGSDKVKENYAGDGTSLKSDLSAIKQAITNGASYTVEGSDYNDSGLLTTITITKGGSGGNTSK